MNDNTSVNIPQELKEKLNQAIADAIQEHDWHIGDDKKKLFTRERKFDIATIIKLLLCMKGGSLAKELKSMNIDATASAFVQQRNKLSWWELENVLEYFNEKCEDTKLYKGYRVLAIDGTAVNMARNPQEPSFMQNASNPKGYNQLHVNPLYDVLNKTYLHCIIQPQPQMDEIGALLSMLKWYHYNPNTIIIADRGYESYNMFAHLIKDNIKFLVRVRQNYSAMREIGKLPFEEFDKDISFTITTTQTNIDKQNGYIYIPIRKREGKIYSTKTKLSRWDFPSPYPMKLRVVRILLDTGEYETLATNLPHDFTVTDIRALYHARWGIETAFRDLKYSIGLSNLHSKKDEFAKQEIFAALIMTNFCNRISQQVNLKQNDNNTYEYAVNMKMATELCRNFYRNDEADGIQLMSDIAKYTEPVRPGRKDERNLKVKSFSGFGYRVST